MRRPQLINQRLIWIYAPQTLPAPVQLELELLPNENELPPDSLEANVESFLAIFWLSQEGQVISFILLAFKTSFSNGLPQSVQIYSKIGIY
jgi:hypothetical protein